jgi:hypothetical protein
MIQTNNVHRLRTTSAGLGIKLAAPPHLNGEAEQIQIANLAVGGSGKIVLANMLVQCDGAFPRNTFAVAIDSDPDLCGLPPEMVITLTVPDANTLVERRKEWPSIDGALPDAYRAGRVMRGSMMKRPVTAGVLLPYYRRRLRDELRRRFVQPMLDLCGPGDEHLCGRRSRILINLISSLGGGFGSGCKDEIPAILRDLFRRVHSGIVVEIVWHAFAPSVHRDVLPMEWQKSRVEANGFASLLEFEIGYHDPSRLPWETMDVRPFNTPLIDRVRLYDLANEQGASLGRAEAIYGMVATALLTESLRALNDRIGGGDANIEGGLSTQENATAPYGSTVAYRLLFPSAKIARFASLWALDRLVAEGVTASRMLGPERTRLATERAQASGLLSVSARVASELKVALPEVSPLGGKEEWEPAVEVLQATRRDFEQIKLIRAERRAAELVEPLAGEWIGRFTSLHRELLAAPSRHTCRDLVAVWDGLLETVDGLLARTQNDLAKIDLAALAGQYDRALALLREVLLASIWFFKARKVRQAHLQASNALRSWAAGCVRAMHLRTTSDILGRLRPVIVAQREQLQKTVQAGVTAAGVLEALIPEARQHIGQDEVFIREAVNGAWAEARLPELFAGVDWKRWADELFHEVLPSLHHKAALESFLNGACADAVEAVVRPRLDRYHITSEEMLPAAIDWLGEVLERAKPHFSFVDTRCGEAGQTYYAELLAAGTREAGDRLRRAFTTRELALVETGDPRQIVFTAQRRLAPPHAAVNSLEDMERAYRAWVAMTADNPEAEVHSTRVYIDMDREPVIQRMLGRPTGG